MFKSKTHLILVVLLLGAILLLPGLLSGMAKEKKVVTFNSFFSGPDNRPGMEAALSLFEKTYPDIDVIYSLTAHEDFKTMIRTWLTSANPPDVFTWFAGERAKFFVDKGLTMDITDVWEKHSEGLSPFKNYSVFEGKARFIPILWYWWGIWYRKSLFDKYGLTPPKTWDEFLKICQTFKENGITPIAIGTKYRWTAAGWFDYLDLRINGRDFHMKLMAGKESYTDPRVYKVFEVWKKLIDKGYFLKNHTAYSWEEAMPFFLKGKAAMYLNGAFILGAVPENLKEDVDFFQFPIIDPDVPVIEEAPTDGFMASKGAPHPKEAKIFLDFLASKEAQEAFAKKTPLLAANTKVPDTIYGTTRLKGKKMLENAAGITQFYDRDTTPPMADKGLDAFVKFMQNPAQYKKILAKLDKERKEIFGE